VGYSRPITRGKIGFATLLSSHSQVKNGRERRAGAAGEPMPVVELAAVTKAYENKLAVNKLNLSIDAGQMFGLLGPNGAGKTSSIRMMMGITIPDSGRVSLFDKPFERKSLERVGYLPEERGLYKKMKVLDQLVFFGQLHGLRPDQARKRAQAWAERLEIAESLDKKTEELSKGMQQKIQFIASLLHDPGLIVMDEPFSGLDPVNAVLVEQTLLELKDQGKAILFSTHRMDQVEKLCDSICLVNNGQAVLAGKVREIKATYKRDRVVVEFEGNSSFLNSAEIAEAKNFSGHAEIRLKEHGDAQKLLHEAAAVATIYRFELVEPSLEEIFIQTVGGKANA
jgi:ABC-2 type transport system ATP-binding protein